MTRRVSKIQCQFGNPQIAELELELELDLALEGNRKDDGIPRNGPDYLPGYGKLRQKKAATVEQGRSVGSVAASLYRAGIQGRDSMGSYLNTIWF